MAAIKSRPVVLWASLLALVLLVTAGQDPHQRRFPDPVDTQYADAISRLQAERSAFQDRSIPEFPTELLGRQNRLARIESDHDFPSASSIRDVTSVEQGSIFGANRAIVLPSRPIRNFAKFQAMSPAASGPTSSLASHA